LLTGELDRLRDVAETETRWNRIKRRGIFFSPLPQEVGR